MAETQPDFEGAWYCAHLDQFDADGLRNFCPPEGCPKGYCARNAGWSFGDPSPAACTGQQTERRPPMWILVNIGCIEGGVSSNIVGVFSDAIQATYAEGVLKEKAHWRENGQNQFEIFEMPEIDKLHPEYKGYFQPEEPTDA